LGEAPLIFMLRHFQEGTVMSDPEIYNKYLNEGFVVDPSDYSGDFGQEIVSERRQDYTTARWRCVDEISPGSGSTISDADFSSSIDRQSQEALLSSFDEAQRTYIARKAMFHEITPSNIYWNEAARELSPLLNPDREVLSSKPYYKPATPSVENQCATLIERRSRNCNDLRGDSKSLRAFASLAMSPDVNFDEKARCDIAAHYFAQTRLQNRAQLRFLSIRSELPEEADDICEKIRIAGVEPEVMNHFDFLRTADSDTLRKDILISQNDVLHAAREGVVSRHPRSRSMTREERCQTQSRIVAADRLVAKAQEGGINSEAMQKANKQLFALSNVTGGAEAAMVAPEAVRAIRSRERAQHRDCNRDAISMEV
jgi:hypothetical protein